LILKMQDRKKSFAAGMKSTQGLARTASQVFFKQERTENPITHRPIFWINALFFLSYFAGALAIVIMFFKQPATLPGDPPAFSTQQAPFEDWGHDAQGNPCPAVKRCTGSPTTPPPTTRAPVTNAPISSVPTNSPVTSSPVPPG